MNWNKNKISSGWNLRRRNKKKIEGVGIIFPQLFCYMSLCYISISYDFSFLLLILMKLLWVQSIFVTVISNAINYNLYKMIIVGRVKDLVLFRNNTYM